jgi:hypothetical protein
MIEKPSYLLQRNNKETKDSEPRLVIKPEFFDSDPVGSQLSNEIMGFI